MSFFEVFAYSTNISQTANQSRMQWRPLYLTHMISMDVLETQLSSIIPT